MSAHSYPKSQSRGLWAVIPGGTRTTPALVNDQLVDERDWGQVSIWRDRNRSLRSIELPQTDDAWTERLETSQEYFQDTIGHFMK